MLQLFQLIKSVIASIIQAIRDNSDVKKLVERHPKFFGFLKKRLHWRDFTGLPLTFIVIITLYLIFLFFGILTKVLVSGPVVYLDVHLSNLLYTFRDPILTEILYWFTLLGSWQILLIGTVAFVIIFWIWRKKVYIISFLLSMGLGTILGYLGKIIIQRPRPQQVAVFDISSYSFPSLHATLSLIFYGFIAYFLVRNIRNISYKVLILFYTVILILAIGFSRMYLGFHFLSDIYGGWILGGISLLIGITLTEWILKGEKHPVKIARTNYLISFTIFILAVFLSSWLVMSLFFHRPLELAIAHPITQINNSQVSSLFADPYNLPKYSETPTAVRQEPISLVIISPDDQALINSFSKIGWSLADPPTIQAIGKIIKAAVLNQEYINAPVTPSFWNGRVNSFGFEKPTDSQTVRQRHHARFWRTDFVTESGDQIYFGTASLDVGVKWFITHKIDPNIDAERDYLFNELKTANLITASQEKQLISPELGHNFISDLFFTDGKTYFIYLNN